MIAKRTHHFHVRNYLPILYDLHYLIVHRACRGEVVNISSYTLRPGDVVAVREKSKSLEAITTSLASHSARQFNWLEWDAKEMVGKFVSAPERDQIPEKIQEQLIVELYSK
jgi:small subunit ribosomal protein S4